MFLKFGFTAALFLAAAPIAAQPPAAPPAPQADPHEAEIQSTAQAFGQCISTGLQNLSDTVTPEAGAASVLGACATQRDALTKAVNAAIAALPADQRATAQAQFQTKMGEAQGQIAEAIRQHRAAAAAPAAPATPATPH